MSKINLPSEVAGKYKLARQIRSPKMNFGKFGSIDFEKLTLKKADRLVARGFKGLTKKPESKSSSSSDSSSSKSSSSKKS